MTSVEEDWFPQLALPCLSLPMYFLEWVEETEEKNSELEDIETGLQTVRNGGREVQEKL